MSGREGSVFCHCAPILSLSEEDEPGWLWSFSFNYSHSKANYEHHQHLHTLCRRDHQRWAAARNHCGKWRQVWIENLETTAEGGTGFFGWRFLSAGHSNGERSQTKKAGLRMGNTAHTTVHETSVQFVFGVHVQSACLQCPQTTQSQILPGVCTGRSSVDPCVQADKATMYWPLETTRVLKALGDYISSTSISIGLMHVGCHRCFFH